MLHAENADKSMAGGPEQEFKIHISLVASFFFQNCAPQFESAL